MNVLKSYLSARYLNSLIYCSLVCLIVIDLYNLSSLYQLLFNVFFIHLALSKHAVKCLSHGLDIFSTTSIPKELEDQCFVITSVFVRPLGVKVARLYVLNVFRYVFSTCCFISTREGNWSVQLNYQEHYGLHAIKDTTDTSNFASYIDRHLEIVSEGQLRKQIR